MGRIEAHTVTDLAGVARVLARTASGRVLGAGVLGGALVRMSRRRAPGPADALAVAGVALAWPVVEWVVHRHVLHAPVRTIAGRRVDLAPGHRAHHGDPDDLARATLPGAAAVLDTALLATAAGAVAALAARSVRAPAVATAGTAAAAALLRYEWVHLCLHAGRRPRTGRVRRLRVHHRLHHHRSDAAWFGVTTRLVDRVVGTDPRPADARRGGTVAGTAPLTRT